MNKTTNLIFPYSIKGVEISTNDIKGQIIKVADTILQLKAARKDFPETNVSVVTADGFLYVFTVNYSSNPDATIISFNNENLPSGPKFTPNNVQLDKKSHEIVNQKYFLHISTSHDETKLALKAIYIQEEILWFSFRLNNYSLLDFSPDNLKFFVQDKKKVKRKAIQKVEIIPLNKISFESVPGNDMKCFAIAFRQFTIPKDKRLICQISEQGAGRVLTLHINHNSILKAKLLEN